MKGTLRISFPCPIVVMGGSNLPKGQELGADVIDVEGEDEPPTPSARKQKGCPPPGYTEPLPPKAPRTAGPMERAERAEPAAGRGQRGAVHEWVEH